MNNKKSNAGIFVFIGILICLFVGFNIAKNNFEKSPEYTLYQTVTAFRDGDYKKIEPYIDFESLADKTAERIKEQFMELPEVKAFPNKRYLSIMFDRIMDKKKATFKEDFKKELESKKYITKEIESTPDVFILAGLIIKKYGNNEIIIKKDAGFANAKANIDGKTKYEATLKQNKKGTWIVIDAINNDLKLDFKKTLKKSY